MSEPLSGLERDRRLIDLLTRALDVPAHARAEFVHEASAGDPALAEEVLTLLAGESQLSDFLERPALEPITASAEDGGDDAPDRVGSFRLLRQLGEGGMGQVFLAMQTEPVERRVALKLMQPALSGPSARARFQAERQALARLSHRNVAQLFESGTTSDGRLFFAMEVIDGPPITDYCDRRRLDVDARLRLFIDVCMGVQHAHEHRLVHRDLKPSNVLVAEVDGQPVPKVIDFGIAKALDRPLSEKTALTGRWFPGAPAYTSPEALESGSTLDVRSDVYSLGVLLHELLTGVRPFEEADASPVEVLRRIQDDDARRPSAQLANLDPALAGRVAAARQSTPAALSRRLAGDLDWIVLRALAKDRSERYQSAAALAADVRHHLAHEPVEARPPAPTYRLRKFLRRHRAAAAVAAAVAVALVAGAGVSFVALSRARNAERAAAEARAARTALAPLEPAPLTSDIGLFWSPRLSPDAQRIVYVRRTDDSADLILRSVADGRETPLRASPAHEYSPAWSPDGSTVAFLREEPGGVSSVMVIDVASGRERLITTVAAPPFGAPQLTPPHLDWSPDGAYLVVAEKAADSAPYRLALIEIASGAIRALTNPPGYAWGDTAARFSPDGRQLLVCRHSSISVRQLQIYDFDPERGLVGPPRRVSIDEGPTQEPAWAPDGRHVVFTSGADSRLWFAPATDPAAAQRILYTPARARMPDIRAASDGRWLLTFVQNDHDVDIFRIPLRHDGGAPRAEAGAWPAVAQSIGIDARPALSPDGRHMAFTSDRTGSLQIWIADLESGRVRQLTRLPPNPLGHLDWSPDGSRIAFVTTLSSDRGRDLFTARVSDGHVEPIVQRDLDDKWQWWSLDGRSLFFVGGPDGASRIWRVASTGGEPTLVYDRNFGAFRERPGGGYILAGNGLWMLPASLEGPPVRLTSVNPYDSTSFDITPGGIYLITGDRRLLHYGFTSRTLTTVAELPNPVRAGVVVSADERHAFVPLAEERIRLMLVDDLRPALGL